MSWAVHFLDEVVFRALVSGGVVFFLHLQCALVGEVVAGSMCVILCLNPLWPGCGHIHNRGISAKLGGPCSPGLSSLRIDSSVWRIL